MSSPTTFEPLGKAELLYRENGDTLRVQKFDSKNITEAHEVIRRFSFAPLSNKTLVVPSVAALFDDETYSGELTEKGKEHVNFAWLKVESSDADFIKTLLRPFPIHSRTIEHIVNGKGTAEVTEIFPSCGYVFINVADMEGLKNALEGLDNTKDGDDDEPEMIHVVAFEQFLITIHCRDISGSDLNSQIESMITSNSNADPVSLCVCALISRIVKEYQKEPLSLLVEVDNVNEMVLQIQPSQTDQKDLLRRIEATRHRLSRVHASFLAKERLVRQLLLPVMRHIFIASDASVVTRYQRMLSGLLLSIERLRKGRDVLNLSSMSLVSGVAMRLLQSCHRMDFLNNIMTQVSLVAMPICILPGLFTMNVKVPFEDSEGLTAFASIAAATAIIFIAGMCYPLYKYFKFKTPKALVPPNPY